MPDDQVLRDILRPAIERIVQPGKQARLATISSAHDNAGNITGDAIRPALPPLSYEWWLPGTLSAGTNVGAEYELAGSIRVSSLRARCKTAPTGAELLIRLTANGAEIDNVSIVIGETNGRTLSIGTTIDAGAVLRLDIVTGGSAVNGTVVMAYGPVSS